MIDVCWGKRKRGGKSVLQCSCITIDWPSVLLTQPLNRWIKLSFTQHSSILSSSQYSSPFSSCHFLLFISFIFLLSSLCSPQLYSLFPFCSFTRLLSPLPSPFHLFCLFRPLPSLFPPLNSSSCLLSFFSLLQPSSLLSSPFPLLPFYAIKKRFHI